MDAASKVRWGIIGPGTIARAFAAGVERSTSGRLVALGARDPGKPALFRAFPGRPGADAGGAARRSGGRGGLYRHPASAARRMGDQGGRSRQARAGGEALRHDRLGGRRHVPCGAAGGHLHGRSVHVPVPPADREAPRSDRGRHDRRGPDDQVELRLRHAGFRSGAPALFQRDSRAGASSMSGAIRCRWRGWSRARRQASRSSTRRRSRAWRTSGRAGSTSGPRRSWAFPAASSPRSPARSRCSRTTCCGSIGTEGRIEVTDFWFASGKQGGTGVIEIIGRDGTARVVEVAEDRWLYAFEADAAGEAIRAGRQEFAAPGMTWDDTLGNLRVLDKWRAEVGLTYGFERADERPRTVRNTALVRGAADPAARDSRAGAADVGRGPGVRGFPDFRRRINPFGRLLRARRHVVRHRLDLWRRPDGGGVRRVAAGAGGAGRGRRSSARGRIRR